MWDVSSLTRDETRAPAVEVQSLNPWTAREVPLSLVSLKLSLTKLLFLIGQITPFLVISLSNEIFLKKIQDLSEDQSLA